MKNVIATIVLLGTVAPAAAADFSVEKILKESGFQGGLIVHLGCGDGQRTAELASGCRSIVQGLDTSAAEVAKARAHLQSLGLDGTVSAAEFDGRRLPYVDNLVNLVVAEDLGDVAMPEVMRVLCPGGMAYVHQNGKWTRAVKPRPAEIDDWTHYLYDPQGMSVSNDRRAGHPRGMQWTGGPFWARSHEHTASMTAMVSAAGRVFYVMDEGPVASIQLRAENVLTARDAFNGTVLWKRPLEDWWNSLYPLKSGPGWLPRRLVAVGERVYLAPGIGQNLVCLDAVDGSVVREYDGTASRVELIVSGDAVFAVVDTDRKLCDYRQQHANCWRERDRASAKFAWNRGRDTQVVKAIDTDSGKPLWQMKTPAVPMTLAANDRMVCFSDGNALIALDRKDGKKLWSTDVVDMATVRTGYSGPRLVLHGDRILFSPMGHIAAISAETGEILWSLKDKPRSGHYSLEDFYVIDDEVWVLQRGNNGAFTIFSLETGDKLREHRNPIRSFYIHQRCYPGRATCRVQLPPMMGIMVYDMQEDAWYNNHWVRGGCIYGVMPANGMVYATPHACACYYQSKLNGFNALTPEAQPSEAPPPEQRLAKGPAYANFPSPAGRGAGGEGRKHDRLPSPAERGTSGADWPTFRHDNARSGYVETDVPAELGPSWKKDFGTEVTQPVVAGGKLFVSAVDAHTVYALDADSGSESWRFIAGGRVNSPPTVYKGLALFGCADGWIYALRANDGALAWKFRAAPIDRRVMSYGQLESVWPLAGSVLVQDGKLYTVAGRSMFLDGGLRMVILEPETGKLIAENVMDNHVPGTKKPLDALLMGKHMPVAMPDILSGDGQYVYMKSQTFKPDGRRVRVRPQRPDTQYDEEVHLFSPISFLDDAWHQRTYWIYGRAAGEGWAEFQLPPKRVPCGRILSIDENNAYGFGRDPELMCNTSVTEYRLYCADKTPSRKVGIARLEGSWIEAKYPDDRSLAAHTVDWKQLAQKPREKLTAVDYHWVCEEPDVLAKAMVLAGDRLFVAGPRDVVDERQMWGRSNEKEFQEKMRKQAEWLVGEHGGVLQVFSKKDGTKQAEYELPALPKFDGLIAAAENLYLATEDGSILCYRGK